MGGLLRVEGLDNKRRAEQAMHNAKCALRSLCPQLKRGSVSALPVAVPPKVRGTKICPARGAQHSTAHEEETA